jgi:branched-chain amino acid transport system substrate-binding protein
MVLCLPITIGLNACSQKTEEIRIGVIAPLSGDTAADYGIPTVEGAELAVNEINAGEGFALNGRKYHVRLFVEDNQDKAEVAVAAAKKLINRENVMAVVGLPLSRNAIPVAKVAEEARVPMISCKSTNPQTTAGKKYVFRASFIDPFQGLVLARFARQDLGAQAAAVLYDVASPYNQGLAEAFKQTFEEQDGQVVAFETYTTDRKDDFSPQLERIHQNQAEVLFLPNYSAEVILQAQQARRMGITATLLGGDAWKPMLFANLPEFDGSYFSEVWHPDIPNKKVAAFLAAYRQAHNKDPRAHVLLTYDSVGMIFTAMKRQGKANTESIREGLYKMGPYHGLSGMITFKQGGDPVRSAVILQIKGGQTLLHKQVNP